MCLGMLGDASPISSSFPDTRVYAQISSLLSACLRHWHRLLRYRAFHVLGEQLSPQATEAETENSPILALLPLL